MKDGTFVSRIAVEDNRRMARTVESIKTVILRVAPFCGNNSVKPIFRIRFSVIFESFFDILYFLMETPLNYIAFSKSCILND